MNVKFRLHVQVTINQFILYKYHMVKLLFALCTLQSLQLQSPMHHTSKLIMTLMHFTPISFMGFKLFFFCIAKSNSRCEYARKCLTN